MRMGMECGNGECGEWEWWDGILWEISGVKVPQDGSVHLWAMGSSMEPNRMMCPQMLELVH